MPHRGSPQQPGKIFFDGDGNSFSMEDLLGKFGPASNTGTKVLNLLLILFLFV
jgi:hypothetical protein